MNHLFKMRLLLIAVGVLFFTVTSAQKYEELKASIVKQKPLFTESFNLNDYKLNDEFILLPMSFNSAQFQQQLKSSFFSDKTIVEIYLVYTAYILSERFSQPKLNSSRLDSLKKIIPNITSQSWINWKVIAQTNAKNDNEARKLFHGFIIRIRKQKSISEEISLIKEILSNDSLGKEVCDSVKKMKLKYKMKRTGKYIPNNIEKQKRGIVYNTKGIGNSRRPQMKPVADTLWTTVLDCSFQKSETTELFLYNLPDKSVYEILERNKSWKDIAIVCDVTGSMYIYSIQLLIWSRANKLGNIKHVTFFNDGDGKADGQKKTGQTGGIYTISPKSYKQVDSLMTKTMQKGNGGDVAENDLEALIKSINSYSDIKNLILIADNNSPIKDYSLISKINKPVRVILCDTEYGINTQYLDLAWATKGSVHTVQNDFYELEKITANETITIEGRKYMLNHGRFVRFFE